MTGEYTFVTAERQNELTCRIQQKLAQAASKRNGKTEAPVPPAPGAPEVPQSLSETSPATILQ
jgi:hypothetical protein